MELQLRRAEYGLLAEKDRGKLSFRGTRYLGFERKSYFDKETKTMEENGTYRWSADQQNPKKKKPDLKRAGSTALVVVLVLVVLTLAGTCFYTVDDKQQAVVTTFGKVTDVTDAGVHFKLPFGIQQVEKVDVNVYQKIELGYSSTGSAYNVNESESTMITGDYNIVNVDFFVEYKISDPVQYLYSSNDPELILRNLIQSQVRNVVGSSTVDAVLTDGKENIQ
ncbi:MAG: SPFH domain-containing protein, partial [Faecousia sp.]